MAKESDRKLDVISVRVSWRSRFAHLWVLRESGESFTTLIERAVGQMATKLPVGGKTWDQIVDDDPGVSFCRLFLLPGVKLTKEEEAQRKFIRFHRPFFYAKKKGEWVPRRECITVLWPSLDYLVDQWERSSMTPYAVGDQMRSSLRQAKIPDLPEWPQDVNED